MTRHDLSPREAVERWLAHLQTDRTEETLSAYHYRLKLFVEWCEDERIDSMADLDGWLLDQYETERKGEHVTTNTLKNELTTLQNFLTYCARIEIVDGGLSEKIDVPEVPREEQASSIKLNSDAAEALLEFYRNAPGVRGCRRHALLEVFWHTGCRMGGLRALDLDDFETLPSGERYLVFRNRPASDTRLKKGQRGERAVLLPAGVADVLETYISQYRHASTDAYGREPLFTSNQGRPAKSSLRTWIYRATVPCEHGPCPHDRDPTSCEYLEHNKASGCPSSRSPHQIRTGAITWLRDQGMSEEAVADRVNASVETIRQHYDKQDPVREMVERRGATFDIVQESDKDGN